MGGVNLPTTYPQWQDQRLLDGKELTPDEARISEQQTTEIVKTYDLLNTPVQKGDWQGAKARVDALQKQFESYSPEMKKYMYNMLQSNHGGGVTNQERQLSGVFHYRLSSASRDKLLKILNPDHKVDHIKTETLNDQRAKAAKEAEQNIEGLTRRKDLERQLNLSTK